MKTFLTLAMAAASVMAMNAETIWEGNVSTGSWGSEAGVSCVQIGSAAFATAAAGDKIVVTVSDVDAGTEWPKYVLKNADGWGELPGGGTVDTTAPGDYTSELSAEAVEIVKANGMIIQGDGVTLTKVELQTASAYNYVTLWEGNGEINWDFAEGMPKVQGNTDLAAVKNGDVIAFTLTAFSQNRNDWPKVSIRNLADQDIATLELWDFIGMPFPMVKNIVVTDAEVWKNGFYCVGPAGTTVTKVELGVKAAGSQNDNEIVLWEGEPTLLTWGSQLGQTSATTAAKLAAGNTLVVTVNSLEASEEWPKVICNDNSWSQIFSVDLWDYKDSAFPLEASHVLTEADINGMKDGFFFCGPGAIISRIVVKTGDDSGITDIIAGDRQEGPVNVYSITGQLVRANVAPANAAENLASGIYIINGKKMIVR